MHWVRHVTALTSVTDCRCVSFPEENTIVVNAATGDKHFQYDHVFTPTSTQAEVFEETKPLVTSVLDGYNVCIFAYGQVGSGETSLLLTLCQRRAPERHTQCKGTTATGASTSAHCSPSLRLLQRVSSGAAELDPYSRREAHVQLHHQGLVSGDLQREFSRLAHVHAIAEARREAAS